MHILDIIARKRDGYALTEADIALFIEGYTRDDIPDYQAAALLMAICIRGMDPAETTALTQAMAHSGDMLDLSDILPYAVDKHSSGGVGDKTSLVVLPLVAACDVPVAKMSGRGLGLTGGTLDKMEAISGFRSNLDEATFRRLAVENGLVLAGQTRTLAPADGKLYALRDVTATVPSIPLIASSIMSKKLAAGANGIVLDVKVGSGAFMGTLPEARELARMMVAIGERAGRDMVATISDMSQPLGHAVGHAVEVREAVETLRGDGPLRFREHCLHIAGHMLRLAGHDLSQEDIAARLDDGAAFEKFRAMVVAQGGNPAQVDHPHQLPQAAMQVPFQAERSGTVTQIVARKIAQAVFALGGGRSKKGDMIDLAVGIVTQVSIGDRVQHGDTLAVIHANDTTRLEAARDHLMTAFAISDDGISDATFTSPPLFYEVIYGEQHT